MSTRATYCFCDNDGPAITLYVHHDGYPEGAAQKVRAALALGALTPENFIRANEGAEIVYGHTARADTQYQYTFMRGCVVVAPVGISAHESSFAERVEDFLTQYAGEPERAPQGGEA